MMPLPALLVLPREAGPPGPRRTEGVSSCRSSKSSTVGPFYGTNVLDGIMEVLWYYLRLYLVTQGESVNDLLKYIPKSK